jgi:hypothetical protein
MDTYGTRYSKVTYIDKDDNMKLFRIMLLSYHALIML